MQTYTYHNVACNIYIYMEYDKNRYRSIELHYSGHKTIGLNVYKNAFI